MRRKLFMLLTLLAVLPALADTGVCGVVIDSRTGQPIPGATILLDNQGNTVTTGPNGDFSITDAQPGKDFIYVLGYGFKDYHMGVELFKDVVTDMGTIRIESSDFNDAQEATTSFNDVVLSESELDSEEGETQTIATLTGANDDPYYKATNFTFSIMRFRPRGYNSEYTTTMINGVDFNDAIRGRFNYSMTGGLNQAFRNKSIGVGLDATSYSFGNIGGANNISTFAKDFAPGLRASVSYTNSNYRWRGMLTYSTGLNKHGWALVMSVVGRYAGEGIIPGSFYNSIGYFLSVQKVFNQQHSLALTTFGAPTKRASNSAIFEECADLVGNNLYNSNWGWQMGKKRNARVVDTFDPTVILNWLWKPKMGVSLNTGVAYHKSFYASSALNWHNARDPRPDYYRYLPSYYKGTDVADLYTELWQSGEAAQLKWDHLYNVNYLNNVEMDNTGKEIGSTYSVEKRHSNLSVVQLNSTLNARLGDHVSLQGGFAGNYTRASYYKTMKDLLGGRFWEDIDQYAERDFPENAAMAENDMDNPGRKIHEGDRFGYDYNIHTLKAKLWKQTTINLAHWDLSYALQAEYNVFWREGFMRNGRAPENSKGRGSKHEFITVAAKAGATYKIDGRNSFTGHIYYGTQAPLAWNAYVSPRIKDDVITDLKSEKVFSADLSYNLSYRRFKGVVTAFYTDMRDGTERTSFYDDLNGTFMNYALTGVHKVFKGIEVGASYKITNSVTLNAAGTIARYRYKNRPLGTRSYENGSQPDVTQTVYLKNFYVGGTPQEAYTFGVNWAGPKMWFVEVSGTWLNRAYVDLSPIRHEEMPNLYTKASTEAELQAMIKDIANQEKLNEAFVVNLSIGHVVYLNRRASLNFNVNIQNLLDNRNIQTGGYQQGRFDYKNYTTDKYPNKYYYAQGLKLFVNVGVRF